MTDQWLDIDDLIEDQLKLQVEIAYHWHQQFMVDHGLRDARKVLDLGTGNGLFLQRLAKDYPKTSFVGADKRSHLLQRGSSQTKNIDWLSLDAQDLEAAADILKSCDGVLMRYFLLHVPNARTILSRLKNLLMPGAHFWIIDVDLSNFECSSEDPAFEDLKKLVHRFCAENSIDTFAGRNLGEVLTELGFSNIKKQSQPFASDNTPIDQFVRFLKQEVQLYSHLLRKSGAENLKDNEILNFIDSKVRSSQVNLRYGMIHWHATT